MGGRGKRPRPTKIRKDTENMNWHDRLARNDPLPLNVGIAEDRYESKNSNRLTPNVEGHHKDPNLHEYPQSWLHCKSEEIPGGLEEQCG